MTANTVLQETDDRVVYLTLNRSERRNAFNASVIEQLSTCLSDLADRDELVAVVLRGNGPCFCAGADLDWMEEAAETSREENRRDAKQLADMLYRLYSLPMPTVVCAHGAAFGGGLGLVSCCDIALAYGDTTFALSEVRLGLIPATIAPYVLDAIGERQAKRYMLTAEPFDGHRAREMGLVHEVIQDGEQMEDRLASVVSSLRNNAPQAMRKAKQLCRDVGSSDVDPNRLEDLAKRIADTRTGDEAKEGIRAFLEDRSPRWRGEGGL